MPTKPQHQTDAKNNADTKHRHPRSATIEFLRRLIPPPSPNAWFKRRQKIARQLETASDGKLFVLDNACRADGRVKVQHIDCECVFFANIQDVRRIGAQLICPYCNWQDVDDLCRFGSAHALREYIEIISLDCLDFLPDNKLTSSSADYNWRCLLHGGYMFTNSFDEFAKGPNDFCPICRIEHRS